MLVLYEAFGASAFRLSGELPPLRLAPSGTRAGILDGVLLPVVDTVLGGAFLRNVLVAGVAVAERDWPRPPPLVLAATLPARDADGAGADLSGTCLVVEAYVGPADGVLDRGGRLLAAVAASSST